MFIFDVLLNIKIILEKFFVFCVLVGFGWGAWAFSFNCIKRLITDIKNNYVDINVDNIIGIFLAVVVSIIPPIIHIKLLQAFNSIYTNINNSEAFIKENTSNSPEFNMFTKFHNDICLVNDYEDFLFKKVVYDTDTACLANDYAINLAYWEEMLPLIKRKFIKVNDLVFSSPNLQTQKLTETFANPLVPSSINEKMNSSQQMTEILQTSNIPTNSLNTIASFCADNQYFILLAGVAIVVGYGIWLYFSYKNALNAQEFETITNTIDSPTLQNLNADITTTEIMNIPEIKSSGINLMDIAIEPIADVVENEIFDNLFLEILNHPSLEDFINHRIDRILLQELLKKIEDVLTLHAPAMDTVANIVSNFPPAI